MWFLFMPQKFVDFNQQDSHCDEPADAQVKSLFS